MSTASGCTSPKPVKARWCCSCTATRKPPIRGATSCTRSPRPATTRGPDQRGYGPTEHPSSVEDYTIHHLVGDAVGLITALGAPNAVAAGHDWGSPVAWGVAQCRPDLVRGVVSLSVPFQQRAEVYFQEPGGAEREFEGETADVLLKMFYWYSGDAPGRAEPDL